jgi:hypothetical protein
MFRENPLSVIRKKCEISQMEFLFWNWKLLYRGLTWISDCMYGLLLFKTYK